MRGKGADTVWVGDGMRIGWNSGTVFYSEKIPEVTTIKKIGDGLDVILGEFFGTPVFELVKQDIRMEGWSRLPIGDGC